VGNHWERTLENFDALPSPSIRSISAPRKGNYILIIFWLGTLDQQFKKTKNKKKIFYKKYSKKINWSNISRSWNICLLVIDYNNSKRNWFVGLHTIWPYWSPRQASFQVSHCVFVNPSCIYPLSFSKPKLRIVHNGPHTQYTIVNSNSKSHFFMITVNSCLVPPSPAGGRSAILWRLQQNTTIPISAET